ncbi:MAG: hypothetical protein JOS17DRAFT_268093 [Linnemannia elongata]|nr:MAG: hypothetical protein JOS17DRAFT_268093 [Linnemannia elongata]
MSAVNLRCSAWSLRFLILLQDCIFSYFVCRAPDFFYLFVFCLLKMSPSYGSKKKCDRKEGKKTALFSLLHRSLKKKRVLGLLERTLSLLPSSMHAYLGNHSILLTISLVCPFCPLAHPSILLMVRW